MKKLTQSNKFLVYIWLPFLVAGIFLFNVLYVGWATEFRPAGSGGGDAPDGTVTSDGNNIYSGTATFQQTVTISSAQPTFELQDTTASEDDFVLQVQGSGIHLRNEQDSVTYLTVDSASLFTLGNSTGGTILNGAGGAVSIENATPIFELSDTTGAEDDFLLRAQTSVFTLENEIDAITYLNINAAHDVTLGSVNGRTIVTSASGDNIFFRNGEVWISDTAPILMFEDTDTDTGTGSFRISVNTDRLIYRDIPSSIDFIDYDANNDLVLGNALSTVAITADSGGINLRTDVTLIEPTPLLRLQDNSAAEDDFLFQVNASQVDFLNETDTVTYFSANSSHLVTVGSSSGGTIFTGSGGAVSVENATPIFELSDTTGSEDDFLLRAQTSVLTIENETDAVTYLSAAATHNLSIGSTSGTMLLTSSDTVTVESGAPFLELSDSTSGDEDFFFRVNSDKFELRNEQNDAAIITYDTTNDITIGNSGDSAIIITSDSGGITLNRAVYYRVVTLADAVTIATNAQQGNQYRVTLGGNRTLGVPTNARDGQRITWEIRQDATGSRTLAYAGGSGGFLFGTDLLGCTLSTGALSGDFVAAVFSAVKGLWHVVSCMKGY